MQRLENFCSLLFELSNEDRLRILDQISAKPSNVSGLSKELNLTSQESSRHVSRLNAVGMIQKDKNGFYNLTSFGVQVLKQTRGLSFVSRHKEYFSPRSLAGLPEDLVFRIGELEDSKLLDDISAVFYNVERLMKEAKEYVWVITDHYLMSTLTMYTEAFSRRVRVRTLEPVDWVVPKEITEAYRNRPKERLQIDLDARQTGLLEEGMLNKVEVFLYMSEKETAILGFPYSDGRFDYLGFTSKDERTHRWCKNLFEYYWKKAKGRTDLAEELYEWIRKKPRAIKNLEKIESEKITPSDQEQVQELEKKFLAKGGQLTILGELVLLWLHGKSDQI